MKKRTKFWAIGYGVLLACFTGYILLDTFVIAREMQTAVPGGNVVFSVQETFLSEEPTQLTVAETGDDPFVTQTSYQDENICISIESLRYCDTNVYIADVTLSSAQYLKTAFAEDTYGKNITATTSETAQRNNAILAVNGDYYGSRTSGYVIRNGYLYRNSPSDREALTVYSDGSFEITAEGEVPAETLLDAGAYQVFSFGPGLVENGEVSIDPQYEVGKAVTENPRTAIGMIAPLHYVFVVTDGRSEDSRGLTVRELAELMVALDVQCAYNLDGGGSSTLYFNGTVINDPGTTQKQTSERSVSDIVYIG